LRLAQKIIKQKVPDIRYRRRQGVSQEGALQKNDRKLVIEMKKKRSRPLQRPPRIS
jgi:hypothetical protein